MQDLVRAIERQISESGGVIKCSPLMDLSIVHYLWESWSRGRECGELEQRQVAFEESLVRPGWSKTVRMEPSAEIPVGSGFLEAATRLISSCEVIGQPIGNGFLFRPFNEQRTGFKNESMSSGTMIQQRLKEAGLFEGETLHSFRRSAVQHAAEIEGYNVERLMQRGRWCS